MSKNSNEAALILIVEDNEKNRRLLRDVLEYSGYRTLEAVTGEEGVKMAREHNPALVLMDIQLPGIDGFEALAQLRAHPSTRETPVIAVTASAMLEDRDRIDTAGFDGYESKPIKVKKLLARIQLTLERPAAAEQ